MRSRAILVIGFWLAAAAAGACARPAMDDARAGSGSDMSYVASRRGQVFYWRGCENWRSIPQANQMWFAAPEEAEAAGFRESAARGCGAPERASGPTPIETGHCTVDRVIDGDTVQCAEAKQRIRLLMVDAPELSQPPFGEEARIALEEHLPPGMVARVELDVQHRDPFGRILAYLYVAEGSMVNELMARSGFALLSVYPPNVRHEARLRSAVEDAREAGRGLWSRSGFECTPADSRGGRC